jgi:hypothetical protein
MVFVSKVFRLALDIAPAAIPAALTVLFSAEDTGIERISGSFSAGLR